MGRQCRSGGRVQPITSKQRRYPFTAVLVLVLVAGADAAAATCKPRTTQACIIPSTACGGIQTCDSNGNWGACLCAGGLTAGTACTSACDGLKGNTYCDASCREVVGCMTSACSACGEKTNGRTACPSATKKPFCIAPESCNKCDDDGDGIVDNVRGTTTPITQTCNPNGCTVGGSQTCISATWTTCTGCSGTGTCTVCGGAATFTCSANSCTPTKCTRAEVCNKCDDDGDGKMDNGVHCPKCGNL